MRMNLEATVLSEINQKQEDKLCVTSLTYGVKRDSQKQRTE